MNIIKECHLDANGRKTCYLYSNNEDSAIELINIFYEAKKDFPHVNENIFKIYKLKGYGKLHRNVLCISLTLYNADPFPKGYTGIGCKHYYLEERLES